MSNQWKPSSPGGGYTPPIAREQIAGNTLTIANGATASLPWSAKSLGDDLLDLSVPASPTIVTAGIYAFAVIVAVGGNMTAGGSYALFFDVDTAGDGAVVTPTSPPAVAAALQPQTCAYLTYYVPAGGILDLEVTNRDGVQDLSFSLAAQIQRLT